MSSLRAFRALPALPTLVLLAAGAATWSPVRASAAQDAREAPGRLVIVGGALSAENGAVYQAILEAREGSGPVCVLPTASGAPAEAMENAVARLDAHGGGPVAQGILLTVDRAGEADSAELSARLRGCSGFFFTGGDQSRVLDVFRPSGRNTPAYTALMERWQAGAVVAGTSAGAAMMSARAIAGGSSSDALAHGIRSGAEEAGVWIRPGMGFVPWAAVDQHFLARGRWGRLLTAVVEDPAVELGVGIDENTALVVDGDEARVVGSSGVVWLDARDAVLSPADGTGQGLVLRLLGSGDRIDIPSGRVIRGDGKQRLPRTAARVEPPSDPFGRWGLLHLLVAFSVASQPEVVLEAPGWTITLAKANGFEAAGAGPGGVEGTPVGLSVGPIRVAVHRAGNR